MTRRNVGLFLVMQGLVGVVWWVLLYQSLTVRDWFVAADGWPVARSIVLADLVGFGAGSIVVGLGVLQRKPWVPMAAVSLVAVTGYATLVAIAWIADPVDRWLGALAMAVSFVATAVAARWIRTA